MNTHTNSFEQWKQQVCALDQRVSRLQQSIHERGWKFAHSVGIGRCGCSLHNAAIDDSMTGWCYQNPERLRVAKAANRIVNDFSISDLGQRIKARLWNRFADSEGWVKSSETGYNRPINVHLLFARDI